MVQTRLAIIDLATGDQPIYEPGGAALVANAEIYNYLELRAELRGERPIAFSTQSDCEPPLHLFRRHGLDFTRHLRGMYAIALYDPAHWIARRAEAVGPLVARSPAVRELCRPDAVATLFAAAGQKRAGRAAWTLLFYALWRRRHIERAGSPPDTPAALAEAG